MGAKMRSNGSVLLLIVGASLSLFGIGTVLGDRSARAGTGVEFKFYAFNVHTARGGDVLDSEMKEGMRGLNALGAAGWHLRGYSMDCDSTRDPSCHSYFMMER